MRLLTVPHLLIAGALVALGLSVLGSRTVVYRHTVEVLVSDPTGRLGSPPVEVSVFDRRMGTTGDWAREWMGPTSDDAPYTVSYTSSSVATLFDPPRPAEVDLALAVPSYEARGFFTLVLKPRSRSSGEQPAAFVPYGDFFPADRAPTLTVRYAAKRQPNGWRLVLTVLVPPGPER